MFQEFGGFETISQEYDYINTKHTDCNIDYKKYRLLIDNAEQSNNFIKCDLINANIDSKNFGFTQPNIINHELIHYGLYNDITNIINQYLLADNFVNWSEDQIIDFFKTKCSLPNYNKPPGFIQYKFEINNLNLSNLNFDNLNLSNLNFDNCNINYSSLKNCNFNDCRFYRCTLNKANFSGSVFVNTDFNTTDAYASNFIHTNFYRCNIKKSTFICVNFKQSYFQDTIFDDTDLNYANLTKISEFRMLYSNYKFYALDLNYYKYIPYINDVGMRCSTIVYIFTTDDAYANYMYYRNTEKKKLVIRNKQSDFLNNHTVRINQIPLLELT
jgi:uncharacterized protein YjbI with pentapeptide repeats